MGLAQLKVGPGVAQVWAAARGAPQPRGWGRGVRRGVGRTGRWPPLPLPLAAESGGPPSFLVPSQVRLAASMWAGGGFYPLLPWSAIVLESVPEASLAAARSRPAGAGPPPAGGPPTAEDLRTAKVRAGPPARGAIAGGAGRGVRGASQGTRGSSGGGGALAS